jgi:exopolysaccharide biosynthesis protein
VKTKLPKIKKSFFKKLIKKKVLVLFFHLLTFGLLATAGYYLYNYASTLRGNLASLEQENATNLERLAQIENEIEELKSRDEYKINQELNEEVKNIQTTYTSAVTTYEELLKLKESTKDKTDELDEMFTDALVALSKRNYSTASATLKTLSSKIKEEREKIAALFTIPQNIPQSNAPPGAGYSRQRVTTDAGTFLISIVAADIGNIRVIVDTASDSDCSNDCPVLPLASYVSRNGAFAGVNGSYFCPATYPSCAGKTNSFDLLVMNHKKTYFNSGNNVYSTNPAVIFGDGYIRFVNSALEWGRDTSPAGVLSNFPMLVFNSEIRFGGDDDPKKGSRGGRSFVANKGNTVYIGVVHSATVAESARVMKALGMQNAMNLDNGGSTALWSGGYKVGPGRNLPNVILFVRK